MHIAHQRGLNARMHGEVYTTELRGYCSGGILSSLLVVMFWPKTSKRFVDLFIFADIPKFFGIVEC